MALYRACVCNILQAKLKYMYTSTASKLKLWTSQPRSTVAINLSYARTLTARSRACFVSTASEWPQTNKKSIPFRCLRRNGFLWHNISMTEITKVVPLQCAKQGCDKSLSDQERLDCEKSKMVPICAEHQQWFRDNIKKCAPLFSKMNA